jgi:TPR repeat protein
MKIMKPKNFFFTYSPTLIQSFLLTLGDREDITSLRRSAELGYGFAQAWMAGQTRGEEKFKISQVAAGEGERDGFYWLGRCFRDGEGCEKKLDKAKENFLRASEQGDVWAMSNVGTLLDEFDPERWRWWGLAAARGNCWPVFRDLVEQVDLFNHGHGSAAVVFVIGQALQGHVNEQARRIFNEGYSFVSLIGPAKQAIAFYEAQIQATKDAMRAWTQIGLHFGVVKDVRKLIAKLIWESREEALYKT